MKMQEKMVINSVKSRRGWDSLPGEAADLPFLEVFSTQLAKALSHPDETFRQNLDETFR